jgi:hypothetical protein
MDFKIDYQHDTLDYILLNYIKVIYERYKIAQNLKFEQSVKYKALLKEYNLLISFGIGRNIIDLRQYKIEYNDTIIKATKFKIKKTKFNKFNNNLTIKSIKHTIKKTKFNDSIINLGRHNIYRWNDESNQKRYIGLTNLNEFNIFKSNYIKSFKNIYSKLQKYTLKYNKTYNEVPYIHLSNSYIDLSKFKPRYGNTMGKETKDSTCYNPEGLWFSCGISWLTDHVKGKSTFNNMINMHPNTKNKGWIHLPSQVWIPRLIYRLDISKLKIITISNCNEMQLFEKKYYNKNMTTIEDYINWKKVYKDYDGLIICPYLNKECYTNKIYDEDNLLKLILKGSKIEKHDLTGFWASCFDASSGVIWKNYNNLSLHLIN